MEALRTAEEKAAAALINFAKSNRRTPTVEEMEAVEEAMRLAGCNDTSTGRTERRKIEAQCLLRDCITSTTRTELRRVEVTVMEMAGRLATKEIGYSRSDHHRTGFSFVASIRIHPSGASMIFAQIQNSAHAFTNVWVGFNDTPTPF